MDVITFLSDDIFLILPMNQIVAVFERKDEDDNYFSVWLLLSTGWAYQFLSDNERLADEIKDILEGAEVDTILHVAQIINRGKDYDLSIL